MLGVWQSKNLDKLYFVDIIFTKTKDSVERTTMSNLKDFTD
jgi:hypothetical protein